MEKIAIDLIRDSIRSQKESLDNLSEKVDKICEKIDGVNENRIQPLYDFKLKITTYAIAFGMGSGFTGAAIEDIFFEKAVVGRNKVKIEEQKKGE